MSMTLFEVWFEFESSVNIKQACNTLHTTMIAKTNTEQFCADKIVIRF